MRRIAALLLCLCLSHPAAARRPDAATMRLALLLFPQTAALRDVNTLPALTSTDLTPQVTTALLARFQPPFSCHRT